jgi:hypothetical protein
MNLDKKQKKFLMNECFKELEKWGQIKNFLDVIRWPLSLLNIYFKPGFFMSPLKETIINLAIFTWWFPARVLQDYPNNETEAMTINIVGFLIIIFCYIIFYFQRRKIHRIHKDEIERIMKKYEKVWS